MLPFGLPKLSADPVLYLPLWLGTLRDYSGYGNHTAATNGHWNQLGYIDGYKDGYLTIQPDQSLELGDLTFFWAGHLRSQISNEFIYTATDQSTRFYLLSTGIGLRINGVTSTRAVLALGSRSLCVTATAVSALPNFYVDGTHVGMGNNALTAYTGSKTFYACGFPTVELPSKSDLLVVYNAALSAAEIAVLHTWSQRAGTPRKQWHSAGLMYPGRPPAQSGDTTYFDNIQTARVSLANETAGQLSNTGLTIITGTWKLTEDAAGRYLECIASGKLRRTLIGASGMTTEAFEYTGTASLTKGSATIEIDATTGAKISAVRLRAA